MTDPQIVGNSPNQKSLYDVWYAVSNLTLPAPSGDQAIINSATGGKTVINVAGGGKTFSDVVTAIAGLATAPAVTSATLQSAQTSTGVGTAFTVTGMKMVAIQVTSTVVGTITYDFEASVDGANFMTGIDAVDMLGADNLGSITQTGAGTWIYQIMCAGITKIQCNITANAATGGTSVTVTGQAVA
jgi:hypothetical protein